MSVGVRSALAPLSRQVDAHEHVGLLLDRYVTNLGSATDEEKRARGVLIQAAARRELPDGYAAAFERRLDALGALTPSFENAVVRTYRATCRGRIITGIGRASVTETSIALLHTWGVPYLPGSGLKGLAAHAARHRAASRDPAWSETGPKYQTLFGAAGEGGATDEAAAGAVTFFDAWWEPGSAASPLAADVMTVHHQPYYSAGEGGAVPSPTGANEPNPVPFLTASGRFVFALAGPAEWVETAARLLEVGLSDFGLGAKTAAGYGRMSLTIRETPAETAAREAREAAGKAFERVPDAFRGRVDGSNAKQVLRKLVEQRDKGCPADVLALAAANVAKAAAPGFEWKRFRKEKLRDAADAALADLVDRLILPRPKS